MTVAEQPLDEDIGAPELSLGELEARLGFHLRLAQTAMWRDFSAAMAELDLTQRQAGVLELIACNEGVSQVDLAAKVAADRPTMMSIVDKLEDRGLIQRRRSQGDRRRQELHMTADGRAAVARARALIAEHERRFLSRFSKAELDALMDALKRIHGLS